DRPGNRPGDARARAARARARLRRARGAARGDDPPEARRLSGRGRRRRLRALGAGHRGLRRGRLVQRVPLARRGDAARTVGAPAPPGRLACRRRRRARPRRRLRSCLARGAGGLRRGRPEPGQRSAAAARRSRRPPDRPRGERPLRARYRPPPPLGRRVHRGRVRRGHRHVLPEPRARRRNPRAPLRPDPAAHRGAAGSHRPQDVPGGTRRGDRRLPSMDEALRALSDAVLAIAAEGSVDPVLQRLVDTARELADARYAAIGIPDGDGGFATFLTSGMTDAQYEALGELPRTHGLLGAMLESPEAQRYPNIQEHPRFEGWPSAHPNMRSFLGVPIVSREHVAGAFYLTDKRGGPRALFTDGDEELIRLLAAHAAIAIENAQLHERSRELSTIEERKRLARELHDSVTQTLFSILLTAEAAASLVA